jgi:hypothetical protein
MTQMRSALIALLAAPLALATPAFTSVALADCKTEVMESLEKQRKAKGFRMNTDMVSETGPVKMQVEYMPPDRMRQVVTVAISPKPVETILVGSKAWTKDGDAWVELGADITKELTGQLDEVLGDEAGAIGTVACLGSTAIEGTELVAYRIENDASNGPKDMSPDAREKAKEALADEARPLRMFFVDPKTGLPARSVFARANKLDKPIFKATYAYPPDIKIDVPVGK